MDSVCLCGVAPKGVTGDMTSKIYYAEIIEGRDKKINVLIIQLNLKTRLIKVSTIVLIVIEHIWGSVHVIKMDSGFGCFPCVKELHKKGVYASKYINNKQYLSNLHRW